MSSRKKTRKDTKNDGPVGDSPALKQTEGRVVRRRGFDGQAAASGKSESDRGWFKLSHDRGICGGLHCWDCAPRLAGRPVSSVRRRRTANIAAEGPSGISLRQPAAEAPGRFRLSKGGSDVRLR